MSNASMSSEDEVHIFGVSPSAGMWLPIETAPTMGQKLLLWCPTRVVQNKHLSPICIASYWGFDAQVWVDDAFQNVFPTHWMPLPEPPAR